MDKPVSNVDGINAGFSAPSHSPSQPAYAGTAVPGQPYYQHQPDLGGIQRTPSSSAEKIGGQAREAATNVAQQAGELAHTTAQSRKAEIAESIRKVAGALRSTRSNLGDQERSVLPLYVDKAADRFEQLSDYLRSRDVREMVSDVERTARKEPALFLGGAFALGFLATRFFKSSSGSRDEGLIRKGNR